MLSMGLSFCGFYGDLGIPVIFDKWENLLPRLFSSEAKKSNLAVHWRFSRSPILSAESSSGPTQIYHLCGINKPLLIIRAKPPFAKA